MHWRVQFIRSLLHAYIDDEAKRLNYLVKYHFDEALMNLIEDVQANGADSRFQNLCKGAHQNQSDDPCSYNIARALLDAKQILTEGVSSNPDDWAWGNFHYKHYTHSVWSKTPFKDFFEAKIYDKGSPNTLNVSKVNLITAIDSLDFASPYGSDHKFLLELAEDPSD